MTKKSEKVELLTPLKNDIGKEYWLLIMILILLLHLK
jgi:hypothetical protein